MSDAVLRIDPEKKSGPVRRLNGVGGGPVTYNFSYDASAFFKEAHIPFSRTHDIEYPFGSGEFVDIHNVFPVFDRDENDPASYNFVLTDEYLKRIEAAGVKPLFRLGNSIEHQPVKRHIHPPKDFSKWGRICSHIIAHYNEGWADGFYMGIEYFEIWNEPDIGPCWTGTEEQILALYDAAATVIKQDHPQVKVGGLAFADPRGALLENFLAYCEAHGTPLDFISWHGYVRYPETAGAFAREIREKMDRHGFVRAESVYDEWNYVMAWGAELEKSFDFHKTPAEAAFMGALMSTAQKNAVDIACYYDVQLLMEHVWNGVFEPGPRIGHAGKSVRALPGFFALKYWGELYGGTCVDCSCDVPSVYATASQVGEEIRVLLSNFEDKGGVGIVPPQTVCLSFAVDGTEYRPVEAFVTDDFGSHMPVDLSDGTVTLRGYSLALVTLKKA